MSDTPQMDAAFLQEGPRSLYFYKTGCKLEKELMQSRKLEEDYIKINQRYAEELGNLTKELAAEKKKTEALEKELVECKEAMKGTGVSYERNPNNPTSCPRDI